MEQDRNITPILKCKNISKTYKTKHRTKEVIGNISMEVKENEFVVLFGPGQCGKTTMLNILSGLEKPTTPIPTIPTRLCTTLLAFLSFLCLTLHNS